jgi:hypothetical protein
MADDEMVLVYLTDDQLEHAGVKGMKWGVRKSKPQRTLNRRITKETISKAHNSEDVKRAYKRIVAIGATYVAVRFGPAILQESFNALAYGAASVNNARNARAAADIIKAVGANVVIPLSQQANGVWG